MENEGCYRSIICFQGSNGRVGGCHCLYSWRQGLPPFAFKGLRSTERTGEEEEEDEADLKRKWWNSSSKWIFFPYQMPLLTNRDLET